MVINGQITLQFAREKETANTVRFKEVPLRGEPVAVGLLYLRKDACEALGNPEALSIKIEAAE